MKVAFLIARILLGLMFVVFGLNAFFHYIPMPPLPKDVSGQFMGALFESHYVLAIGAVQAAGGLLLLAGRYVPLGLTLLGPVIVNILLYHFLMSPAGVGMALVTTLLWFIVFFGVRKAFRGLWASKVAVEGFGRVREQS